MLLHGIAAFAKGKTQHPESWCSGGKNNEKNKTILHDSLSWLLSPCPGHRGPFSPVPVSRVLYIMHKASP